jgi:hypothetical protein
MKPLNALLLLMMVSGYIFAQAPSASNEVGGLAVLGKKWNFEVRNPSLDQDPIQETGDRQEAERQRLDIERRNEMLRARGMPTLPVPQPLPPPRTDTLGPKPGPTVTYIYQVNLRNTGSKEVSAVTWEYVFSDNESGKEIGRRRFVSRERIRPGKSAQFKLRSAAPPAGSIAAEANKSRSPKFKEQIVILSVEYADGTKWSVK